MKANELRLGNLLTFNGKIRTVDGVSLVGSHKEERHILVELNYMYKEKVLLQIDKIDPILLTEEWLLMFGFEKNEYTKDFRLGKYWVENRYYDCYEKSMFLFGCYQFDKIYITSNAGVLKYVHQLQNLYFALTGEELEIKL